MGSPKVTIALPVYNGENYLAEAIESLLASTFEDFELVISDNCSTDSTADICRRFAADDPRVRYHRTERNLGAAPNFNRAWELARGRYFRWAAHDDRTAPEFLERCVEVLDDDPGVVLAHTQVRRFDGEGDVIEDYDYRPRTSDPSPSRRFYELLFVRNDCYEIFGLIRSDVLAQTAVMGNYPVGDRVLLSELAFRGRFHEVPERLFFSRDHGARSVRSLPTQQERAAWFDARYEGKITLPEWRTFAEYEKAIYRSPLDAAEKARCQLYMLKWLRHYRKRMRRDVTAAARQLASRVVARPRDGSHP